MLDEVQPAVKSSTEFGFDHFSSSELVSGNADGPTEGEEACWGKGPVRLQEPVEFLPRLLVEDNVIQPSDIDTAGLQAITQGVDGEARIVLAPGEPLFLRGGHDHAITDEGRRGVVVERRYTQNVSGHCAVVFQGFFDAILIAVGWKVNRKATGSPTLSGRGSLK